MKTIGILGGMGPEATIYQYQLILKYTPASKDQDHIPVIIYSNPKIPDRTTSILKGEHEEIIKELARSAKLLEKTGVDFIIIPCNTAHYYIEKVRNSISIPIIDMIKLAVNYTENKLRKNELESEISENNQRIGILATNGTIQSEVYQRAFNEKNLTPYIPDSVYQKKIMEVIYKIKRGGSNSINKDEVMILLDEIRETGNITWFILGCTELPLLFQEVVNVEDIHLIDPMEIMAKHIVKVALSK